MKSFWQKTIESGFSLLEIIITLSLLTISLVAIITVATKILHLENITENDFVAKGLLVEAISLTEAKRNANVATSTVFYSGMATSTGNGDTYSFVIDYTGMVYGVGSVTDAGARLKYDDTNFFQHTTGSDTKFYRRVVTTYSTSNKHSLAVEAQIYWVDRGGKANTQKLSAVLYNTAY